MCGSGCWPLLEAEKVARAQDCGYDSELGQFPGNSMLAGREMHLRKQNCESNAEASVAMATYL